MSLINPNDTRVKGWSPDGREPAVRLYLSGDHGDMGELMGARAGGWPLQVAIVPVASWIDPAELSDAPCALIQVDADNPSSVKRFGRLAEASETPLIAVSYEPPLALVRALIRAGAHDVVPLPLNLDELESSLAPLRQKAATRSRAAGGGRRKLITAIKSRGGIGASAVLGQMATRFATIEARAGREACLLDLDIQFGDAAVQLGLQPPLNVGDMVEAGARLDGAMLRATTATHPSGLAVLAAPRQIMPLDMLTSEQALTLIDLATREFGTVFVDLPHNWTNWSLSVLARSDIVLLVTELRVSSLYRARRQIDLLASQDLDGPGLRVIVNRVDKGLFRTISAGDAERVLGRPIHHTIANDAETMAAAIDRGIPVWELRRKAPLARDLDSLAASLAAAVAEA